MSRGTIRNAAILIYMVGNALTFNAVLKAARLASPIDGDWTSVILKTMAISLAWPGYWLMKLFT